MSRNLDAGAPSLLAGRSRQNLALLVLAAAMMFLIFAGSLLPVQYKAALHTHGRFHSWLHVLAFGAVAFVAGRSTRATATRVWLFSSCLALGLLIELLEAFAYHGAPEWRDVLVDAIGISVATLAALLLDRTQT